MPAKSRRRLNLVRSYECDDEAEAKALFDRLQAIPFKDGNRLADTLGMTIRDEPHWWYSVDLTTPSASRLVAYDRAWREFMAPKYVEKAEA